jgi:CheY-like chemotaxis protein
MNGKLDGLGILFVEDDPLVSSMMCELLKEQGAMRVTPAPSVAAGLHHLEGWRPHVAAVDVSLGAEQAWPLVDVLAQQQVPFFLVSGYGEDLPSKARRDTAHYFLLGKPYTFNELVDTLVQVAARAA